MNYILFLAYLKTEQNIARDLEVFLVREFYLFFVQGDLEVRWYI